MKIYPVTFVFIFTVSLTLSCIRLTLNPDIDIKSKVIDADTKQPLKGCDIILVGVYYRVTSPPDYFSNCDTLKNSDKFQPMLENYIRNYNPEEKTMYKTQTDDNGVFLITNIKQKHWWPIGVVDPPFFVVVALIIEKDGYNRKILGTSNTCKNIDATIELKSSHL